MDMLGCGARCTRVLPQPTSPVFGGEPANPDMAISQNGEGFFNGRVGRISREVRAT